MPLPADAADDCLHRFNCCETFTQNPPKAWEFLFYIPNPNHPIHDDGGLRSHFCLVLPDDYKHAGLTCQLGASAHHYRAVALITRKPRVSTRSNGYRIFRPHTARCTCPTTTTSLAAADGGEELETRVFDRVSLTTIESPCHSYNRADHKKNRGQFETWSWYANSVIPIQAPKIVHVDCLHLMRPLTQRKFGLTLHARSLLSLDEALGQFKEIPPPLELLPPPPVMKDEGGSLEGLEDALRQLKEMPLTREEISLVEKRKFSVKRMLGRHEVTTREGTGRVEKRKISIKRMLGRHEVTKIMS
ncbi:MAG: hypothetical protein LQ349_009186 [Xanthoria aureola]|nr:MAG: hypothetical protein LQ349_009186 [Xanthoria aureola]